MSRINPGIFPQISLPDYTEPSERRVYDSLSTALPEGWFAWHSLRIRTKPGEFAEGDFLIADPERGILLLEVKGGHVRKQKGTWMQYDRPMEVPPLDQAFRFKRRLLEKCSEQNVALPPVGLASVFPDMDFECQPSQGDLDGLVIGARELPYLDELLPGFLDRALPKKERRSSPGWIEHLHSFWCENWPEELRLSCLIEGRTKRRVRLDQEQFSILEGALDNDLMVVQGGAGTGKTIMAWELARREAARARSVLLLTLTDALGLELGRRLKPEGVTASPIGRFALEKLRAHGFVEEERYEPAFWERVVQLASGTGALWKDCRYDTVIVDEGQDLGRNEWKIVLRCAEGGAAEHQRIWVFADEEQGFWKDREIPPRIDKHAAKFILRRAYRCPPGIQALADAYAGQDGWIKRPDGGPDVIRKEIAEGTIKVIVVEEAGAPSRGNANWARRDILAQAIGDEIDALLKEGFSLSDIAVVSLRGMMYEENIMHCGEMGGHKLLKATDRGACCGLICDTFLRYKGLERPIVIVSDVKTDADKYNVRMNIAISRALGALRVVVDRGELEKDPVLARVLAIGGSQERQI